MKLYKMNKGTYTVKGFYTAGLESPYKNQDFGTFNSFDEAKARLAEEAKKIDWLAEEECFSIYIYKGGYNDTVYLRLEDF